MLLTNFVTTKFPQAGRASGSCLSTGPTGNSLAIGVGSVLISQNVTLNLYSLSSKMSQPQISKSFNIWKDVLSQDLGKSQSREISI